MAKFELVFKESVSTDLKDIPKQDVHRIIERINLLRDDPILPDVLSFQVKNITESAREITG